jgi:outer membrane protein OmpA-like peptidoglycan-associated protein
MRKFIFITLLFSGFVAFAQKSGKYTVKDLAVNTEYSDFGTSFYQNKQVVFSSPKDKTFWSTVVKNYWKQNGQRFLNLYSSDVDIDGELINKTELNAEVNSKYHEGIVAFTNDFKTVYLTRNNYLNKKVGKDSTGMSNLALYKANVDENGEWADIVDLPFNDVDYSVGHPALSPDNKKLYFASDMPGGKGGVDLYVVDIIGDNVYSKPVNIAAVNTPANDMFPFLSKNNVLYYSSNCKKNTLGGLDIYAYNFESAPIRLDSPLNSHVDDFAFIIDSDKKTGYLSSNRSGGKGDDDIYYFTEDVPIVFDCKQYIVAKVIDAETKQPVQGAKLSVFHNGKMESEQVIDATGSYKIDTKCKEDFAFKASMANYEGVESNLKTSEKNEFTNSVELALKPIKKEIPRIILGPVRFDYNKFNIRNSEDADMELDRIFGILNQYPEMIVSIESFTDARGTNDYNTKLSQNRAEKTKEYLVKKGIVESRIVGVKGRGEELLVNQCIDGADCSEADHQLNRRTEFVIVNPESYQK